MIFWSMPIWPNGFQTPVIMTLPLFHIMPGKSYLPRSWTEQRREIDFSKRLPDCAVTIQVNDVELLWCKYVKHMSANSVCLLGCGFFGRFWNVIFPVLFPLQSFQGSQGRAYLFNSVVSPVVCLNHTTQKGPAKFWHPLFINQGECRLRAGRGEGTADRSSRGGRYLLWEL